jgi:hypothetical protein
VFIIPLRLIRTRQLLVPSILTLFDNRRGMETKFGVVAEWLDDTTNSFLNHSSRDPTAHCCFIALHYHHNLVASLLDRLLSDSEDPDGSKYWTRGNKHLTRQFTIAQGGEF